MPFAPVVPSDTTDLPNVAKYVSLSSSGSLKYLNRAGETIFVPAGIIPANTLYAVNATRILAGGTSPSVAITAYW